MILPTEMATLDVFSPSPSLSLFLSPPPLYLPVSLSPLNKWGKLNPNFL